MTTCIITEGFSHRHLSVQTLACKLPGRKICCFMPRKRLKASKAAGGDSDAPAPALSIADARKILGLEENASFEQTVKAKNRMLQEAGQNDEKQMQIEMAYDALLMRSMQARLTGEAQPDTDARYADVRKYRPSTYREKSWQEKASDKLPFGVQVRQTSGDGPAQNLIFGILLASALLQIIVILLLRLFNCGNYVIVSLSQDFYTPPNSGDSLPGLQLGLAFGASLYYLTEKKKASLAKSAGLSVLGLALGTLIGSGIQAWLRVDIVPLGALHSPGVLVAEFSIIGLWAAAVFLA